MKLLFDIPVVRTLVCRKFCHALRNEPRSRPQTNKMQRGFRKGLDTFALFPMVNIFYRARPFTSAQTQFYKEIKKNVHNLWL